MTTDVEMLWTGKPINQKLGLAEALSIAVHRFLLLSVFTYAKRLSFHRRIFVCLLTALYKN